MNKLPHSDLNIMGIKFRSFAFSATYATPNRRPKISLYKNMDDRTEKPLLVARLNYIGEEFRCANKPAAKVAKSLGAASQDLILRPSAISLIFKTRNDTSPLGARRAHEK